jgi:hypothetical protein
MAVFNRLWLTWPGVALVMLLQRTPVIWKAAELPFSLGPRFGNLFKWITGAVVSSSAYHTVTGATGDLTSKGSKTVVAGSNLQVHVQADKAVPVTATIEGELPPGVVSNLGAGGAVANGVIAFGGIPTTAGDYPVTVTVLTWGKIEDPVEQPERSIQVNFEITLPPPKITKNPVSIVVPQGGTAQLSVEVDFPEETTFQWQKTLDPPNYSNVVGATNSVLTVENATAAIEGAYRVRVTRNGITVTTPYVALTVDQTPTFDTWRLQYFDPGDSDGLELENPDHDSLVNAFEFLFDLNPKVPDSLQIPMATHEKIGQLDYAVFAFPPVIAYPNISYAFESTSDLKNGPWAELIHGQGGVIIAASASGTVLKIPYADQIYCRVKVETD